MGIASSQNIDNALVNRWLQAQQGVGADYNPNIQAMSTWLSPYLANGTLDMNRVPEIAAAIRANDPKGAAAISGGWAPGGTFAGAPINSVSGGNVNFDSTANTGDLMGNLLLGAAMSGVAGLGFADAFGPALTAANGGIDQGALGQILNQGGSTASLGDLAGLPANMEYTAKAASDITPTPMGGAPSFNVTDVTDGVLPDAAASWGSPSVPGVMGAAAPAADSSASLSSLLNSDAAKGLGLAGTGMSVANAFGGGGSGNLSTGLPMPSVGDSLSQSSGVNVGGNVLDQFPVDASNTGNSAWDSALNYGSNGGGTLPAGLLASLASQIGVAPADLTKMLGGAIPGLLGAYASNQQTQAYKDLANQYAGYGAPYRQQLADLMANPSSFLNSDQVKIPVQQGTDMLMRSLSTQGNPWGSGNALQQGQNYATNSLYSQLQSKENQLGTLGGLGSFNAAAPQAATSVIGSTSNTANSLGNSVSSIFNPPTTYAQQLQGLQSLFSQKAA